MSSPSNRVDSKSGGATIIPMTPPADTPGSPPSDVAIAPTRPRLHEDRLLGAAQMVGTSARLSQEEACLLSVFVRRRGQIISLTQLAHLIYDEGGLADAAPSQGTRRALSLARCTQVVEALQRKLPPDEVGRRLLRVDGCGYVLWPC